MTNFIISAASPITDSAGLPAHHGGERQCLDWLVHLLSIVRHADYYSAALHVRCIARKFLTGQSLEWHIAGLRRALHA